MLKKYSVNDTTWCNREVTPSTLISPFYSQLHFRWAIKKRQDIFHRVFPALNMSSSVSLCACFCSMQWLPTHLSK